MSKASIAFLATVILILAVIGAALAQSPRTHPPEPKPEGDVIGFCQRHPTVDFPNPLFFGPGVDPDATPP